MDFGAISRLAVIVCVIVSMIVGTLWYNPKTFFPIWWKGIGKTGAMGEGAAEGMGLTWGLTIPSSLVQAVFISLAVTAMGKMTQGGPTVVSGATVGFLTMVGLCRAHQPGQQAFRRLRFEDLGHRSRCPSDQLRAVRRDLGCLALGQTPRIHRDAAEQSLEATVALPGPTGGDDV